MAELRYHVSAVSKNGKTGPMTVTTGCRESCPPDCPLKEFGCFGDKNGPISIHWDKVTSGDRGTTDVKEHCRELRAATMKSGMSRLYQVGNLPKDVEKARLICNAPAGPSFTYSHYRHHAADLADCHAVVNASANTLADADTYVGLPTAVILPEGVDRRTTTPGGRPVVRCPAEYVPGMTCRTCKGGADKLPWCAWRDREFVVGFTPHGSQARKARVVAAAYAAGWGGESPPPSNPRGGFDMAEAKHAQCKKPGCNRRGTVDHGGWGKYCPKHPPVSGNAWTLGYYQTLTGAKIVKVELQESNDMGYAELWPVIHIVTPAGEALQFHVSRDEEGNGPGFLLGLKCPNSGSVLGLHVEETTEGS